MSFQYVLYHRDRINAHCSVLSLHASEGIMGDEAQGIHQILLMHAGVVVIQRGQRGSKKRQWDLRYSKRSVILPSIFGCCMNPARQRALTLAPQLSFTSAKAAEKGAGDKTSGCAAGVMDRAGACTAIGLLGK